MALKENLSNRNWLYSKLRAEIVGPDPAGAKIDISPNASLLHFSWEDFRKPKMQQNGEEILWQDPPAKRYGAGILYPTGIFDEIETARADADSQLDLAADVDVVSPPEIDNIGQVDAFDDDSEEDVTLANAFKPSALGLSFLANLSIENKGIYIEIVNVGRLSSNEFIETPSATYHKLSVSVGESTHNKPNHSIWLRKPLVDLDGKYPIVHITSEDLLLADKPIRKKIDINNTQLEIVVVVRGGYTRIKSNQKLITVSLLNCSKVDSGRVDELCLFQSGLRVRGASKVDWIEPYPESLSEYRLEIDPLSDEKVNELLYRQNQTFAIGHGCAVDWKALRPDSVSEIWTDILPSYETPTISADLFVKDSNGVDQPLKVSMRKLAGLDDFSDGFDELELLVKSYSDWIQSLKAPRNGIPTIPQHLDKTASALIQKCEECRDRIVEGIEFLKGDNNESKIAIEAFRLANHAMLIAQLRSSTDVRRPIQSQVSLSVEWLPKINNPDPKVPTNRGYWRAFQIAFLLMSIKGIVDPSSSDRDVVDLIWFPTGGGKTEAYLGLTAFTIIYNRLSGKVSGGADVLMRYTLRLLTAQQFQRAALLFCALEVLREDNQLKLGDKSFRIGLWVGGTTTPNTRKGALAFLAQLERDSESINPFILLKCPWCGAAFGASHDNLSSSKYKNRQQSTGNKVSVYGYRRYRTTELETVVFRCGDPDCVFGEKPFSSSKQLPIVIIDEDLIEDPPNLVIGTVDKFAMLSWKPSLRKIFGIGPDGKHFGLPPTLIIQDELHLISGPLGSMVGAYETIIGRLCTDDLNGSSKPKIIASTATISKAFEQVKNLYARENAFLFPPSGLESNDSFFAREDKDESGNLNPGRMYVGILAPAHGSLQTTEARVFASLTQNTALMQTDDQGRDPWWTLLCFFNSIRELGSAASLFVSDTRDYLRVILDRYGIQYEFIRKLFEVTELTSRIRSDQVPKELERLEKNYSSKSAIGQEAVDACLASNIIEVGVDISRLSLMTIVGQPKTTSQYIQVSSRVGRSLDKPGLVVVLYGQSKPRDRSHYERFRQYHQKLYAQVEPTSVTPFSPPAVERALHGIIVAAVRQLGHEQYDSAKPVPFPLEENSKLYKLVKEMIEERLQIVAPEEHDLVLEKFEERLRQWQVWQPAEYGSFNLSSEDPPLIYQAGKSEMPSWDGRSWPTVTSLRDVDASCQGDVTSYFNKVPKENI